MAELQTLCNQSAPSCCRTCFKYLNDMEQSFDVFSKADLLLKLTSCTSMSVDPADGLPSILCENCCVKIEEFYAFQQMCASTQKRFRDLVNSDCENKPILSELHNNLPSDSTKSQETQVNIKEEVNRSDENSVSEFVKAENCEDVVDQSDCSSDALSIHKDDEFKANTVRKDKSKKRQYFGEKLECTICKALFKTRPPFEDHMRLKHGRKPYTCHLCDGSFTRRSRLAKHIRTIHEGMPSERFPCPEPDCKKIMSSKPNLRTHVKLMHPVEGQKPRKQFVCEECGKILSSAAILKNHLYLHSGETLPHVCPQCKKRFILKYKMIEHIRRHDGIKKYACPHCDIKKTTNKELKQHINTIHTKEKKFPCPLCNLVFYDSTSVSRHKKNVHEGIRNYACSYCDQAFSRAQTRKHHEMTHTGEKPFECELCDRRFTCKNNLKLHQKVHSKCQL